jgi:hypothetical protein
MIIEAAFSGIQNPLVTLESIFVTHCRLLVEVSRTWKTVGRACAIAWFERAQEACCRFLSAWGRSGCATNKSPLVTASAIDREFAAAAVTWDLNRDGNVTCDEWKQYASDLFRVADVNHDGVLTREEFASLTRQDKLFEVAGFSYFDADGDGQITLSEVVDKPNPAFALLDTILSPEERRGPDTKSPGRRKRGSSIASFGAVPSAPGIRDTTSEL